MAGDAKRDVRMVQRIEWESNARTGDCAATATEGFLVPRAPSEWRGNKHCAVGGEISYRGSVVVVVVVVVTSRRLGS